MLPQEINDILSKYKKEISEEVSNINLSIENIISQLNSINIVLMDELILYAKNTGTKNKNKEIELLRDSQQLRGYIESIKLVKIQYGNNEDTEKKLEIFDIIVLSNTLKCSNKEHETMDITARLPVLYNTGEVFFINIPASYCKTCNKYTMLKSDFNRITGVVMCKVIDETTNYDNTDDELDIAQKKSLLYMYGYNVKSKVNLSNEQRHIILSSVIEANILTRRQIIDHLNILIDRGSKIPKWKEATAKWKQDRYYVQTYKMDELPNVIFDKIILKYSSPK